VRSTADDASFAVLAPRRTGRCCSGSSGSSVLHVVARALQTRAGTCSPRIGASRRPTSVT